MFWTCCYDIVANSFLLISFTIGTVYESNIYSFDKLLQVYTDILIKTETDSWNDYNHYTLLYMYIIIQQTHTAS